MGEELGLFSVPHGVAKEQSNLIIVLTVVDEIAAARACASRHEGEAPFSQPVRKGRSQAVGDALIESVAKPRANPGVSAQHPVDDPAKLRLFHRLDQIVVDSKKGGSFLHQRAVLGRQEYEWHDIRQWIVGEMPPQREAVEPRHVNIGYDEIELAGPYRLHRGYGIAEDRHLIVIFEVGAEDLEERAVVVNERNSTTRVYFRRLRTHLTSFPDSAYCVSISSEREATCWSSAALLRAIS